MVKVGYGYVEIVGISTVVEFKWNATRGTLQQPTYSDQY